MGDNVVKISKLQRKAKSHVKFLSFLLVVLIICFLLVSPVFEIKNISVFGNDHLSSEEIIGATGISCGRNIFQIDKFSVLNNINRISYIKNAYITRVWPNGIKIEVEEKIPVAEIKFYGSKLLLDEDGYIIDVVTDDLEQDVVLLSGISASNIKTGTLIECNEEKKLECYLEVLKILKKNDMLDNVVKIEQNENILIYLKDGYVANFGDKNNLQYKVLLLKKILPKEINSSYIDLSNLEMKTTRPVWGMFDDEGSEEQGVEDEVNQNEIRGEKIEE